MTIRSPRTRVPQPIAAGRITPDPSQEWLPTEVWKPPVDTLQKMPSPRRGNEAWDNYGFGDLVGRYPSNWEGAFGFGDPGNVMPRGYPIPRLGGREWDRGYPPGGAETGGGIPLGTGGPSRPTISQDPRGGTEPLPITRGTPYPTGGGAHGDAPPWDESFINQALERYFRSGAVIPEDITGWLGATQGIKVPGAPQTNAAIDQFMNILNPAANMLGMEQPRQFSMEDISQLGSMSQLSGQDFMQAALRHLQQTGFAGQDQLQSQLIPQLLQLMGQSAGGAMGAMGGVNPQDYGSLIQMALGQGDRLGQMGEDLFQRGFNPGQLPQPGIQNQVQQNLMHQMQTGGMTPEFIQAQREMTLNPAQDQLMAQLNQLGGGQSAMTGGLESEMQRRLERDFMNQMTSLGFQGAQHALPMGMELGAQQFGQGLAGEQLGLQAAGMGMQASGMGADIFGRAQGLGQQGIGLAGGLMGQGFGETAQNAQLWQSLFQGIGGMGLGATDMTAGRGFEGLNTIANLQRQPEQDYINAMLQSRGLDIQSMDPHLRQQNQMIDFVMNNLGLGMDYNKLGFLGEQAGMDRDMQEKIANITKNNPSFWSTLISSAIQAATSYAGARQRG